MTTFFRDRNVKMSRCKDCDHDLAVQKNGTIRCTNDLCRWSRRAYKMGSRINGGRWEVA